MEYSIGHGKTAVYFIDSLAGVFEGYRNVLFVFDENTRKLFPDISSSVSVVLTPGENEKNWNSVNKIIEKAVKGGLARDSLFIGVGGGVVCDLTGTAASLYMRGSGLVLVPTTLLAMADAALGGKTGFDYQGYKNIVGTFYPAETLYMLPEVLLSLPAREYRSGLAEVIKHGFLKDRLILDILKKRKDSVLRREVTVMKELVTRSLEVKGWFVEQDFKEKNIRRYLNLGHTFGHALETATGFSTVSHGEAVAWGMAMALKTGTLLQETDESWAEEAGEFIKMYGYDTDYHKNVSTDELLSAIQHDKKKKKGEIRFVLQRRQGDTFTTAVDTEVLREALSL